MPVQWTSFFSAVFTARVGAWGTVPFLVLVRGSLKAFSLMN